MKPVRVTRILQTISGIPNVATHVQCVFVGFIVDQEGVVFCLVPQRFVARLDFNSQPVCGTGSQLVHRFKSNPEVSTRRSKSSLVVRPRAIVIHGIIDFLMKDYPPVDGTDIYWGGELWNVDVDESEFCHEI